MAAQCIAEQLEFHSLGRRAVVGRFDGGRISSDGGGALLREADLRIGLTARLAGCFSDYRNPASVEHSVHALLAQRIYGVALGYEDLNDHDVLRSDSVVAMLVGKVDVVGAHRVRQRDRGHPLAGSSTLNRLELSEPAKAAQSRYKRIAADPDGLDHVLVEVFVESYRKAPREVWLDLDATDDPLHGHQEGRFSTATTGATAICRCTSSAENICCAHGCAPRIRMGQRAAWRNSSVSWRSCAGIGRRRASTSAATRAFVANG